MHQGLSQYKLILRASRSYYKRRKIDDAKKTCVCIVVKKNHQARDCPIKASALKLHKIRNVLMSTQSKVEDAELEKEDVQPQ
jgi:hypothetical protein